jgi:Tol biopolymer transport system component
LSASDTNRGADVFIFDLQTRTIERVNVNDGGHEADGSGFAPALSGDGRFVAFESTAPDLVPGDTNTASDIFVYDRWTATVERVSVPGPGRQADGPSYHPALSADGRFVAYDSRASNLVPGDTNGRADVFVYDRQTRTTRWVSVSSSGREGNGDSLDPALSSDGRFVAFTSSADNLVPADTNLAADVFVADLQTGTVERASLDNAGAEGDKPSVGPALSADGNLVAFTSYADNLAPGDTNGQPDVFVFDRALGLTRRVSGGGGTDAALSSDGGLVAFASFDAGLVAGDTNGAADVFVHANAGVHAVKVGPGQTLKGLNFGNQYQLATVAGHVFEDGNSNGLRDAGEGAVWCQFAGGIACTL